jgi:glycosyltransferase involved in cell wall biosynthesis
LSETLRISVVVIAKNEAASIARCLQSIAWADEVIVLDSGSTDDTVSICRRYTQHVYETDWPGFGPQKNRALDLATGDWVISLDADEWMTPELRDEIQSTVATSVEQAGFRIPRLSSFCGRDMRHSGWWPDYVVRLFRRGRARFSDDIVHERVIVDGEIGTLVNPIRHETYVDLEDMLEKMNSYSTLSAQKLLAAGKRPGLMSAVLKAVWAFFRTYILRRGFLDGREGFMLAVSTAEVTYYRYAKCLFLDEHERK